MQDLIQIVSETAVNLQTQEQTVIDVTNYVAWGIGIATVGIIGWGIKMRRETYQILNRPSEKPYRSHYDDWK